MIIELVSFMDIDMPIVDSYIIKQRDKKFPTFLFQQSA